MNNGFKGVDKQKTLRNSCYADWEILFTGYHTFIEENCFTWHVSIS